MLFVFFLEFLFRLSLLVLVETIDTPAEITLNLDGELRVIVAGLLLVNETLLDVWGEVESVKALKCFFKVEP